MKRLCALGCQREIKSLTVIGADGSGILVGSGGMSGMIHGMLHVSGKMRLIPFPLRTLDDATRREALGCFEGKSNSFQKSFFMYLRVGSEDISAGPVGLCVNIPTSTGKFIAVISASTL